MINKFAFLLLAGWIIGQKLKKKNRANIIVFIADDLDVASEYVLWDTRQKIMQKGANLKNAYATTSICCPSRSSILTGIYAHNHNVMTNMGPICGGQEWRDNYERRTYAYYLHKHADYKTAMFGKYLNEYDGSYVPPGWDTWHGLIRNSQYYNYRLKIKGWSAQGVNTDTIEKHGNDYYEDYLTDLIANRSVEWIRHQKATDPKNPILLTLNFPAPHGPEDAAKKYQSVFNNTRVQRVTREQFANYNNIEQNPNKNWLLSQIRERLDPETEMFGDILCQKRLQTLLSVDDAVNAVIDTMDDLGLMDNTYFLFTSDHGYHIGQFGMVKGKSTPYEFDIKIPFYVRGPKIAPQQQRNEIALNIDIAPTILGLAGIKAPSHMDGINLAGIWRGYHNETRDSFIIEKRGNSFNRDSKNQVPLPKLPSPREKFNMTRLVNEKCQEPEYIPDDKGKCKTGQTEICILDKTTSNWKMLTCKLDGIINPQTGKCDCDPDRTKKLMPKRQHKRTTRNLRRSHRRTNSVMELESQTQLDRKQLDRKNRNRRKISSRKNPRSHKNRNQPVSKHQNDQSPNNKMITSQCFLNREGRIVCKVENTQAWRKNLNEAIETRNALRKQSTQIDRVIKKLRESKKIQPIFKPGYIPCKCLPKSSFKKDLEEKRLKYREEEYLPNKNANSQSIKETLESRKRRKEQKKRKLARLNTFQKTCRSPGMSCFTVDEDTWKVPPRWLGEPQCHCTSASNQTYSCLRKIGIGQEADQNYLYCEFVTADFKEYYDLDNDPDQLTNRYPQLTDAAKAELHTALAKLKHCRGKQCNGHRNPDGYQRLRDYQADRRSHGS